MRVAPPAAPKSAAQLEAEGATEVSFDFRGVVVTVPLDVAAWPVDAIRAGRFANATRTLLGGVRPPMRTVDDVVELSHRMADAAGITPLPESGAAQHPAFGAIPLLLRLLDNNADDIEADLRRFYRVDLADRWRGGLTLRQIWTYIRRIPADSATATAEVRRLRDAAKRAKQAEEQATLDRMAQRDNYYTSGQNMRDAGIDTSGMTFQDPATRPPPRRRETTSDVVTLDPVEKALAVAKKNAQRTPRKGRSNDRPVFRNGRYDAAGSGWG